MTISDNIFALIEKRGMTQKEFATATGISQSSISDWKRKKTNPVSDKILVICDVLGVTPYELLSGTASQGGRSNPSDLLVIDKNSELGHFIVAFQQMETADKNRLMGYFKALEDLRNENKI